MQNRQDHPRRCGENTRALADNLDIRGSPPQVRGKRRQELKTKDLTWITPAGAGKTRCTHQIMCGDWDHPRRCGENSRPQLLTSTAMGSPPQVRGKLQAIVDALPQIRITPAGAGKTSAKDTKLIIAQDHPRRCGENAPCSQTAQKPKGSPPQVRGKRRKVGKEITVCRITPAGAGKTLGKRYSCQPLQDHPRRCGENFSCIFSANFRAGSPPQVRGKLSSRPTADGSAGITPAGAGKTPI